MSAPQDDDKADFSTPASTSTANTTARRRQSITAKRRSRRVCQHCHTRKLRCNLQDSSRADDGYSDIYGCHLRDITEACKEALESTDNDISRRTQELVQVKLVQYLPLSANPNIGRPPIL